MCKYERKSREEEVKKARNIISDEKLIAFFRAISKDYDVLAVGLINRDLEQGQSLDEIFYTGEEGGYELFIDQIEESKLTIHSGFQAGPFAGDGGRWDVVFDGDKVKSVSGGRTWIS